MRRVRVIRRLPRHHPTVSGSTRTGAILSSGGLSFGGLPARGRLVAPDPPSPPRPTPHHPAAAAVVAGSRTATREPASRRSILAVGLLVLLLIAGLLGVTQPARAATPPSGEPADASRVGRARVVAEEWVASRQLDLTIQSPALGTTAKVRLLIPDGWRERRPGQRWPVLYLLHGCCGDYTSWTTLADITSIPALRDVLVVMPEAGNAGFYSDWWNDGHGGPPAWETFHLREVRSIVERHYGASHRRVVAGLSMGGFGALSYAARHPGMFRAAASYSGVVDTVHTPGASDLVLDIASRYVDDPLALWGDPIAQAHVWAAHNPVDLATRLRTIPVYLSCGNGDAGPLDPPDRTSALETLLEQENLLLAQRLRDLGAKRLVTNFYGAGTHSWPYWEREFKRSLPLLLSALR
ncbi:S-formylglutathione hydrolase FrmB [Thermasporomyces composti]|jgi:S-formylglutathione hydrolase FrmB|uniref:S-formylglutathione hydrolase FrmB n=1 Tax=Thermasporomyces composti TaxID=696763 RepID=A0A3D9V5J4_THECX|nr:S-formylglutathione hydrolase FrmB [Thermasporomyces composti]